MSFLGWLRGNKPGVSLETPVAAESEADLQRDSVGLPVLFYTNSDEISSQGLIMSQYGTAALFHGTTSPPSYYEMLYDIPGGLNMDRGGFGHASDGTTFGVVCDGVTSGGIINLHAAQAFSEYLLRWLAQHKDRFASFNEDELGMEITRIFRQCVAFKNNPGGKRDAEGGSATVSLATVVRRGGRLFLVGAAIGDASCVLVNPDGTSKIITSFRRRGGTAKDTGGQLTMCMGVHGIVKPFIEQIEPQSIILLTTDGFTDNISRHQFSQVLNLIMRSRKFNTYHVGDLHMLPHRTMSVSALRRATLHSQLSRPVRSNTVPQPATSLPTLDELRYFCGEELDDWKDVKEANIVMRITNYLKWVTQDNYNDEELFFRMQMKIKELHNELDELKREEAEAQAEAEAKAQRHQEAQEDEQAPDNDAQPRKEKEEESGEQNDQATDYGGDDAHVGDDAPCLASDTSMKVDTGEDEVAMDREGSDTDASIEAEEAEIRQQALRRVQLLNKELEGLEKEAKVMRQKRKERQYACKTDDALILAMRPLWQ